MTVAQTIGPEGMMQHLNPDEFIKRLAAAQGIDTQPCRWINVNKSNNKQLNNSNRWR